MILERLGVELPIVQAGMGGGIAGHALAAAVSEAGGLGTIGFAAPADLRRELDAARAQTGKPIAVNLLLPFARPKHFEVAAAADAVVTFWGTPRRRTPGIWIHQCGSVAEARAAQAAGADAVIAQGVEAGGHVRGTTPAAELLAQVRVALPAQYPVLRAGGIADAGDVRDTLAAGAAGAVLGTRFVLTDEAVAAAAYKRRLVDAHETVLTELFGVGWPGAHRVVPNAATDRWLGRDRRGPAAVRALNRLTAPVAARLAATGIAWRQRPSVPLYSPLPPGPQADDIEALALYAGETVARLDDIRPAAVTVRALCR